MRISDWSSDVCSSDLLPEYGFHAGQLLDRDAAAHVLIGIEQRGAAARLRLDGHDLTREASVGDGARRPLLRLERSEEHTSELQSLMRISYAVFCLKKKITT